MAKNFWQLFSSVYPMNNISVEQNTEKQLQRLAAQRQLYTSAKKIFGLQLIIGGPVAIGMALVVATFPAFKSYAAFWGMLVVFCDLIWLNPWQKRLREKAAKIQEIFDCDVLNLQWNTIKIGKKPDPELVQEQAEKYRKRQKNMPSLRNWYAPVVDELPLHIGRLACQRSNCWWDSKQRRLYAIWIMAFVILTIVAVFLFSLSKGFTIEDFILKVAVLLVPCIVLGVRQFSEQNDAANRLDKLKEHSENIWKQALNAGLESEVSEMSRTLQNEIYDNRSKSPLVFDIIFRKLRNKYEIQMNYGVAEYVAEARSRLSKE